MENEPQNAEKTWTSQEEEKLREMVRKGETTHQIAVSMGRTDQAIVDKAKKLNVELKQHEGAKTEFKAEGNKPNTTSEKH